MPAPVDVAALLEDLPQLTLVSGDGGRNRPVHRARVAQTLTAMEHFAPGELLVVPREVLDGTEPEGLRALADLGIAAVCVAGSAAAIGSTVSGQAEGAALPLLVTTGSDSAEQLVIAILEALLHRHELATEPAAHGQFAAITLEELVAPDIHSNAEAIERAASLGWDLDRPRAVLLASIDPPVDAQVASRALATIAASARATLGDDAIVWTRSTSTAALIAPSDASARARRDLADALRADLDTRVTSVTLSIGVGRCVDDPSDLPLSFVDAARAVDVGRWAKGRHVTELYDELGLERLFASVPERDLHDFVLSAIGPLLDHDRENRGQLVETLAMWLQTRNMAEASRNMFVHYNTFKNRLERIEAILGPVLTDAARLLECEVAVHVARHYDGPWTDSART